LPHARPAVRCRRGRSLSMPVRSAPTSSPYPMVCTRDRGTWTTFRYPLRGYSNVDCPLTSCGVRSGCAGRECARRDRPGGGSRCQTHAQSIGPARDRRTGPFGDREQSGARGAGRTSGAEWSAGAGRPQLLGGTAWRLALPDARRVVPRVVPQARAVPVSIDETGGPVQAAGPRRPQTESGGAR